MALIINYSQLCYWSSPNGQLPVAVDHSQLRTMALETVYPIDWPLPPPFTWQYSPSTTCLWKWAPQITSVVVGCITRPASSEHWATALPMRPLWIYIIDIHFFTIFFLNEHLSFILVITLDGHLFFLNHSWNFVILYKDTKVVIVAARKAWEPICNYELHFRPRLEIWELLELLVPSLSLICF